MKGLHDFPTPNWVRTILGLPWMFRSSWDNSKGNLDSLIPRIASSMMGVLHNWNQPDEVYWAIAHAEPHMDSSEDTTIVADVLPAGVLSNQHTLWAWYPRYLDPVWKAEELFRVFSLLGHLRHSSYGEFVAACPSQTRVLTNPLLHSPRRSMLHPLLR